MEYEIYTTSDELTHWGIKGMRWGIRRYQNKDGSLTPAGKKKLRAEQAKVREQEAINKKRKSVQASFDRLEARKKAAAEEKKALDEAERIKLGKGKKSGGDKKVEDSDVQPAKKSYKDMTDAELNAAINRARMEETYRQLHPEPVAKPSFLKKVVDEAVVPAAVNAGRQFIQNALTKAGENMLKGKADPNSLEALEKVAKKLEIQERITRAKKSIKKNESDNPDDDLSWDDKKKKLEYENALKDQEYKDLAREYNVKTKRDQLSKLNPKPADDSNDTSGSNSSNNSNSTATTQPASQPVSNVNKQTVHLGKTTAARYTVTGGSKAKSQSKTDNSDTNYPNKKEWDDFQSQYSWGVDKPVTNLSNRTISLGKTTAERYTQTKRDDD